METNIYQKGSGGYPEVLSQLASPPAQIFHAGADLADLLSRPRVAVVGSRIPSEYGRRMTRTIAGELARQGVVIVSGLAYGIDAEAHLAALESDGKTIAVLPGPLDNICPPRNQYLADRILAQGGALISEYKSGLYPVKQNFIARNRIVAGLSNVVIITQAGEKSGALHTANFAINDAKVSVYAVPSKVDDYHYAGIMRLFAADKAMVVTSAKQILELLNIKPHSQKIKALRGRNQQEQILLDLLLHGIYSGDMLLVGSGLDISQFNRALTMLEINGQIRPLGGNNWALA